MTDTRWLTDRARVYDIQTRSKCFTFALFDFSSIFPHYSNIRGKMFLKASKTEMKSRFSIKEHLVINTLVIIRITCC